MLEPRKHRPLSTCVASDCVECKIAHDCIHSRSRTATNWYIAAWLIVMLLALVAQQWA